MEVITLKEYGMDRIGELQRFLNLHLSEDAIDDELFNHITRGDPNFNPELVLMAVEDDKILGVLLGVERTKEPKEAVEKDKVSAWIKALAIDLSVKEKDHILEKLLNEYLEIMKGKGKEVIRYADFASWYIFPGLDLRYEYYLLRLLKRGFRKVGECVDYEVDLLGFRIPNRVKELLKRNQERGIVFRRGKRGEEKKVTEWILEHFGPFWKYEAMMAYTKGERPTIWLALRGEEVIGFSCYSALHKDWFGPIGVDKKARGLGIGTILLFKSLEDMRSAGRRIIRIPWTSHLFFYTQVPRIVRVRHYWQLALEVR